MIEEDLDASPEDVRTAIETALGEKVPICGSSNSYDPDEVLIDPSSTQDKVDFVYNSFEQTDQAALDAIYSSDSDPLSEATDEDVRRAIEFESL